MTELEQKAKAFATHKHAEAKQVRKYTNEPYICHPAAVVEIVRNVSHSESMIAAAWLHDTVEDTNTTLQEIVENFGGDVGTLVEMLTDISKPEDGNRKLRKSLDREHTAKSSPEAKTIKLADIIDNSSSIIEHDPSFTKVFLKEISMLLDVLLEGNQKLWQQAKIIVDAAMVSSVK